MAHWTYDANLALGHRVDDRDYGGAARMLLAPGVTRIRLLSNSPDRRAQVASLGIAITKQIPTRLRLAEANASYPSATAVQGGHESLSRALERSAATHQRTSSHSPEPGIRVAGP